MIHEDLDLDFLPIPDPGSRYQKAPDPRSATLILGRVALHNSMNKDQDSNFLDKNLRRQFNEKNILKR
jgi:hypothetical protein